MRQCVIAGFDHELSLADAEKMFINVSACSVSENFMLHVHETSVVFQWVGFDVMGARRIFSEGGKTSNP